MSTINPTNANTITTNTTNTTENPEIPQKLTIPNPPITMTGFTLNSPSNNNKNYTETTRNSRKQQFINNYINSSFNNANINQYTDTTDTTENANAKENIILNPPIIIGHPLISPFTLNTMNGRINKLYNELIQLILMIKQCINYTNGIILCLLIIFTLSNEIIGTDILLLLIYLNLCQRILETIQTLVSLCVEFATNNIELSANNIDTIDSQHLEIKITMHNIFIITMCRINNDTIVLGELSNSYLGIALVIFTGTFSYAVILQMLIVLIVTIFDYYYKDIIFNILNIKLENAILSDYGQTLELAVPVLSSTICNSLPVKILKTISSHARDKLYINDLRFKNNSNAKENIILNPPFIIEQPLTSPITLNTMNSGMNSSIFNGLNTNTNLNTPTSTIPETFQIRIRNTKESTTVRISRKQQFINNKNDKSTSIIIPSNNSKSRKRKLPDSPQTSDTLHLLEGLDNEELIDSNSKHKFDKNDNNNNNNNNRINLFGINASENKYNNNNPSENLTIEENDNDNHASVDHASDDSMDMKDIKFETTKEPIQINESEISIIRSNDSNNNHGLKAVYEMITNKQISTFCNKNRYLNANNIESHKSIGYTVIIALSSLSNNIQFTKQCLNTHNGLSIITNQILNGIAFKSFEVAQILRNICKEKENIKQFLNKNGCKCLLKFISSNSMQLTFLATATLGDIIYYATTPNANNVLTTHKLILINKYSKTFNRFMDYDSYLRKMLNHMIENLGLKEKMNIQICNKINIKIGRSMLY